MVRMVAQGSSTWVALGVLALIALVPAALAGMDPDADGAAGFDVDANVLGAGFMRGLAAAWDACDIPAAGADGGADDAANQSSASVACQGLRMVRKALAQWAGGRRAVELSSGVELVPLTDAGAGTRASRKLAGSEGAKEEERGLWGRVRAFIQSHELRIRLPQLLPRTGGADSWAAYLGALHQQHAGAAAGVSSARKKDKGGGALIAMMGMMGAMMMAMGTAATGALAMKALGVAGMALVMAIAAALKKLGSKDDGGHHVSVVPVHAGGDYGHHGHRRRRDAAAAAAAADLPVAPFDAGDPHNLAYAAYATAAR